MDLECISPVSCNILIYSTYILEGVDALGSLLNLATNDFRDELLGKLGKRAGASLTSHDLDHLLADLPDLGGRGVGSLADLVRSSFSKGDGEKAEEVVVSSLDNHVGLNLKKLAMTSALKVSKGFHTSDCHFLTSERSLSEVKSRPWKLVRQFLPEQVSQVNTPCRPSPATRDFQVNINGSHTLNLINT